MIPDGKNPHRFRRAPVNLQFDLHIGSRLGKPNGIANDVLTSASKSVWIGVLENDRPLCTETHRLVRRFCFEVAVGRCLLDELNKIYIVSLCRRKPGFKA